NLSERNLTEFCQYFLETCLDQVEYMTSLTEPDQLAERLEGYAKLRAEGVLAAPDGKPGRLKAEAGHLLREVTLRGEVPRGEIPRVMGLTERTARTLLSTMLSEGLLVSDTPKSAVRLAIPAGVTAYWFPNLYLSLESTTPESQA
ncbi:MAG: Fic family protein, partial [Gammaproteobacteria bacterium]|nr:Fic family protein [Gammaproteobacteria bacterium]